MQLIIYSGIGLIIILFLTSWLPNKIEAWWHYWQLHKLDRKKDDES